MKCWYTFSLYSTSYKEEYLIKREVSIQYSVKKKHTGDVPVTLIATNKAYILHPSTDLSLFLTFFNLQKMTEIVLYACRIVTLS